jgi:hypothetical protein
LLIGIDFYLLPSGQLRATLRDIQKDGLVLDYNNGIVIPVWVGQATHLPSVAFVIHSSVILISARLKVIYGTFERFPSHVTLSLRV